MEKTVQITKAQEWLESAMSHLRSAIVQSLPSDDQIIYEHMKSALKDLEMMEKCK